MCYVQCRNKCCIVTRAKKQRHIGMPFFYCSVRRHTSILVAKRSMFNACSPERYRILPEFPPTHYLSAKTVPHSPKLERSHFIWHSCRTQTAGLLNDCFVISQRLYWYIRTEENTKQTKKFIDTKANTKKQLHICKRGCSLTQFKFAIVNHTRFPYL